MVMGVSMRCQSRHVLSCFPRHHDGVRSDRLLATLLLLQTHGRLPAPEIARRLEVSTRTVQRDVEALSASGVPVYCERGRAGGVVLMDGYRTDVTGLTDEEMRALFVVGGTGSDDRGLGPALASAARKLTAALPEARRSEVDRARQRLLVEQQGWRRPPEDVPALPALEAALVRDERLRVRYRSASAAASSWRTVDPYGLVSKAGTWYLVAAHRGRARMYRVGRVLDVRPTGAPARRPDDRTLAAVWAELSDELEHGADAVEVRFRVRRDQYVRVLRLVAAQLTGAPSVEEGEHDVVVTAPFRALGAARGALLGFGGAVEVLEPEALRDDLRAAAEEVVDLYRRH